MVLNNKDMRTIERALGKVIAVADCLDGPKATTLAGAVDMIDNVLEAAQKQEEESRLTYQQVLYGHSRQKDYADSTTTVHNLHNTLVGENEVGV